MTTRYKSCAQWPKGTFDHCNNLTEDTHDTKGQAEAVCKLLRRNGAGGDHQFFPIKTWVEPVIEEGKCAFCGGTGSMDSGGVTPWMATIELQCPKCKGSGK